MWILLKSLLARWVVLKLVLKGLGSLGWLLPVAFLLKAFGLPFLVMLAVLALPLLLVLAVIGLPLGLVVLVGGFLLTLTVWLVGLGVAVLKLALPLLLLYWVVRWMFGRGEASPDIPLEPEAS